MLEKIYYPVLSPSTKRVKHSQGFSLIEILVTVVLLAIGLMGLASLQATSLTNNHSTQLRGQLVNLTSDIVERMRANPVAARSGNMAQNYALAKTNDPLSVNKMIPITQSDLQTWLTEVVRTLPNGYAEIQVTTQDVDDGAGPEPYRALVVITLEFNDRRSREFKQPMNMNGGKPSVFRISSWI